MRKRTIAGICIVFLGSVSTVAQGEGQLAGTVRDISGKALPGVSVEVASAAAGEVGQLLRTDSKGQYRFVRLPPGTYSITFLLSGFWLERREGLHLTTGTLPVNVRMYFGGESEATAVTTESANLTGTVVDDLQAVMPGVALTLTGPETRTTRSALDGRFSFMNLRAGDYELRAAFEGIATGFATTVRKLRVTKGTTFMRVEMTVSSPVTTITVASATLSRRPLPVVHGTVKQARDG